MQRKIGHYLFLLGLCCTLWACQHRPSLEEQARQAIVSQLSEQSQLVLVDMQFSKVVTITDDRLRFANISSLGDFFIWGKGKIQSQLGNRKGIYSFQSSVVGYLDLKQWQDKDVSFDAETQTLRVQIPPIQIYLRGRDFALHTEYEHTSTLRNAITPEERAEAKEFAYKALEEEIRSHGELYQKVEAKAIGKLRIWLTEWLRLKGVAPKIEIVTTPANPSPLAL